MFWNTGSSQLTVLIIFTLLYDILFLTKGMDARRSRTIKIGQSRRKSRTYRPTTSTYLVDLLEQQPATICSEKGKTGFYPVKPVFTPHAWKFLGFGRAGYIMYRLFVWYMQSTHVHEWFKIRYMRHRLPAYFACTCVCTCFPLRMHILHTLISYISVNEYRCLSIPIFLLTHFLHIIYIYIYT